MGDDVVDSERDEPIPATEDDPALEHGPVRGSGSRRGRFVALVLIAAFTLTAALGAWIYFAWWRFEPTAMHHVPSGANVVVRADAAELLQFKPIRTHLWPVLFEGALKGAPNARRVERIEEETGVRIPLDLREVVVASVDGIAWVAVLGGKFAPGRVVDGLHRVFQQEGLERWSKDGDLLMHAGGATIAQAEDGTVIIGTHREIVEAALPHEAVDDVSDDTLSAQQTARGAIQFRVSPPAIKRWLASMPDSIPADSLHAIDELAGTVRLSEQPELTLVLSPKSSTSPPVLASALTDLFSKLGWVLLLVPHDLYGAKAAISAAQVSATEETVLVNTSWPAAPLNEALQLLAKALEESKSSPEP